MIVVRPAEPEDFAGIALLLGQLGYPCSAAEVEARLKETEAPRQGLYVAELDGVLAGVVHCITIWPLHRGAPTARVCALVVDEPARGRGVGTELLAHAESIAFGEGCERMELTSNEARGDAHRFYERHGYAEVRKRFVKPLR